MTDHEHQYEFCEDCGPFCARCGEAFDRLPDDEDLDYEIVSHWHHAGALNGPRDG